MTKIWVTWLSSFIRLVPRSKKLCRCAQNFSELAQHHFCCLGLVEGAPGASPDTGAGDPVERPRPIAEVGEQGRRSHVTGSVGSSTGAGGGMDLLLPYCLPGALCLHCMIILSDKYPYFCFPNEGKRGSEELSVSHGSTARKRQRWDSDPGLARSSHISSGSQNLLQVKITGDFFFF